MWTEEHLPDAVELLKKAAKLEKVSTDQATYVVADGISYTEELYLQALDELLNKGEIKSAGKTDERESFQKV